MHLLLDTGASANLLRKDVWENICAKLNCHFEPWGGESLVGAESSPLIEFLELLVWNLFLIFQTKHNFLMVDVLSVKGMGLDCFECQ